MRNQLNKLNPLSYLRYPHICKWNALNKLTEMNDVVAGAGGPSCLDSIGAEVLSTLNPQAK